MGVESGRLVMLRELTEIETNLRRAAALVNGLRVAVEKTSQEERDGSDSHTVFSVKLKIEGAKQ